MSEKKNWYENSGAIILLLIFFFPVGLYLMWKYAKWNQNTKVVISVVFSLYFFGVFLITLSAITLGSTTQTANQPSEVGTPQLTEPEKVAEETPAPEKKKSTMSKEDAETYCQDAGLLGKFINLKGVSVINMWDYGVEYYEGTGYDSRGYPVMFLQWNGKNKESGEKIKFNCWLSGAKDDAELHWLSMDGTDLTGSAGYTSYDKDGNPQE